MDHKRIKWWGDGDPVAEVYRKKLEEGTSKTLPVELISMRNRVWYRYDQARNAMNVADGTPNGARASAYMRGIRDTLRMIDEEIGCPIVFMGPEAFALLYTA